MTYLLHALALANMIFHIMLVSLLLKLPNYHVMVEARNLVSSHVFSMDLIHRNSPHSPYYDESSMTPQARLRPSVSHGHRIHPSSTYYEKKDSINSNLVPNGGDYLIKIALGTPPVEFLANADTGSDLIWLQCSPCDICIPQKSPLFDPTKSSTFHTIPCNSQSCDHPDVISGCPSNNTKSDGLPCIYGVTYGDGTTSVGILATDTLNFPPVDNHVTTQTSSYPSSIIGCGIDNYGYFGNQGDGIVGLGAGPLSLVSQLGPKINYKFSYCLAPQSSGVNSKLNFGAGVTGPKVVSTPFTTGDHSTYHYHLTLDAITIGDSSVPMDHKDVVIDSGTTLTYLPPKVYNGVKSAITSAIRLSPMPKPVKGYDLCYETRQSLGSDGELNPPDVVFHFEGADVVLKVENSFRVVATKNVVISCLAIVPTNDMVHTSIFGNIAQVNFEVGYDLQAKRVSFVPTDCTKY
ncbi:aspartic proteinase CDR1-like [Chenopodium quinoa]|uniref:Peptidase A1 domain-containing protein n=1 Tax=Chenopodium quinoa TaxID=63459 RepID=A0A803LJ53_CHEQI|nr:aspartic proteinase CDR1-like [Chenopodium quinoa]